MARLELMAQVVVVVTLRQTKKGVYCTARSPVGWVSGYHYLSSERAALECLGKSYVPAVPGAVLVCESAHQLTPSVLVYVYRLIPLPVQETV